MWKYEKKLQYPINIKNVNPKYAQIIISQYGGPDGELGASMRYLTQRYSQPFDEVKGILTDIGIEDLFCAFNDIYYKTNTIQPTLRQDNTKQYNNNPIQSFTGLNRTTHYTTTTTQNISKQYRETAIVCGRINKGAISRPFILYISVIDFAPSCIFVIFVNQFPFIFIAPINKIGNISNSFLWFIFRF